MDISNKTLSLFVLAALIVSLVGVTLTLRETTKITGFATTGSGNVSVTITSSTDITVLNNTIDFGTGVVNTSNSQCGNATLMTNGSTTENTANPGAGSYNCWINATENDLDKGYAAPNTVTGKGIVIRNDGNQNITLTMDSAHNTAANFLGNGVSVNAEYNYTVDNEESGSCNEGYMRTNIWYGVDTNSSMEICSDMKYENATDTVNITFRIVFGKDVTGFKEDNLTFTAAATGAT